MTHDDAVTIVAMITHGWPGPVWEKERLEAYVEGILPWDAELTAKALARARNSLKYRPSIAELREFVQMERREQEAATAKPFVPEPQGGIPMFVKRWVVARFLTSPPDMRPFREQHPHAHGHLPVGASEWMPENLYAERAATVTDAQVWAAVKGSRISESDAIVTA